MENLDLITTGTALVLLLINLVALAIMSYDKYLAVHGQRQIRLSEGLLFFMAAMFGSIGVFIGMHLFHHKTKTWYFQIGIPLLIIQNLATAYVVIELVSGTPFLD